ncbi:maleylacetoacetate isomerase [Vibrio sp. SCSIO 43136]|uniref:maleylacetoacetate isomerase n=1 Tax=Vibrio sp. SCSIO 43136 TaxID=2819101 RepID=UPI002075A7EA|nr:maleylacetoacetate isomerase [Vibrio sp. SCSIO 43136]USD63944.1 maleylacetoacetate isomerase [Vibrio sp. SCSIO 43136]
MILYDYWRSTACYRVRIALAIKGVSYSKVAVNIAPGQDEQFETGYQDKNPVGLVPLLEDQDFELHQSLAIIDYLEESYPTPSLLPSDVKTKHLAKALALDICADVHPINNLRVLKYLASEMEIDERNKMKWYHHWLEVGFEALEKRLRTYSGKYSLGDNVTIVDVCLIPQLYNARRFQFNLDAFPRLVQIEQECLKLDAFKQAMPKE